MRKPKRTYHVRVHGMPASSLGKVQKRAPGAQQDERKDQQDNSPTPCVHSNHGGLVRCLLADVI